MTLAAEPHPAPPQQPTVAWSEPDVDRRVEFWPTVAIRSALESADIATWQRIAAALKRDPYGRTARQVEEVLEGAPATGIANAFWEVLDRARTHLDANARREFLSLQARAVQQEPNLTGHLDGSVSPSASLMIRMRRLSDRFVRAKSVRAADS